MRRVLTTKQRQYLKGLAHPLAPTVRVGKGGARPAVVEELKKALFAHELIKVRIDADESAERRAIAETLATAADAQLVGTIGKIAVLYRAREENPKIRLPK